MRQRELPGARRSDLIAFMHVIRQDGQQQVRLDATAISASASTGAKAQELSNGGHAALQAGDYQTAASLLKRAVEADPKYRFIGVAAQLLLVR